MTDEPVQLVWTCTDEAAIAEGTPREARVSTTRARAEMVAALAPRIYGGRFRVSIEPSPPTEERPVLKWAAILGLLESCVSFATSHKELLVALGVLLAVILLALLGIYLPAAHYRATPIAALALLCFFSGVLACRRLDKLEP